LGVGATAATDCLLCGSLYAVLGGDGGGADRVKVPAAVKSWFGAVEKSEAFREGLERSCAGEMGCARLLAGLMPLSGLRKPRARAAKFYVTTAINYANGAPHMGHAYEAVTADAIARWHRAYGDEVFFLTGSDEHGQKIAGTAADAGVTPLELCDKFVAGFQALNAQLCVSNDDYVRTTSAKHKECVQHLWRLAEEAGDVYLGTYTGWYNVREETFVTEKEAMANDYLDPASGKPLVKTEESSYFFRQSKYQARLVEHIKRHPEFVQPESRRKELLLRLEEPLLDLSVSRTTFNWGIPVVGSKDHVMYVWFDALSNYLSGVDYHLGEKSRLAHFWPANVHIIGKDILWFHAVIWPCILMSVGAPLPRVVMSHGFVNAADGKKMSKSLGNVLDPHDILKRVGVDTFRYYMCRETRYGSDMPFSEAAMALVHNADLADSLGNMVHRAVNLAQKFAGGVVPDVPPTEVLPYDLEQLVLDSHDAYEEFRMSEACDLVMEALRATNRWVTEHAPWHIKDDPVAQQRVVRTALEAIYAAAHFLSPYLVSGSAKIAAKLNTPLIPIVQLRGTFDNLKPGTKVDVGDVLYNKILSEEEQAEADKRKAAGGGKATKAAKEARKGGAAK